MMSNIVVIIKELNLNKIINYEFRVKKNFRSSYREGRKLN